MTDRDFAEIGHTDGRTALACAYEGDQLVAILYSKKAVRECEASGWLTVSRTPEGEKI